jgi:hypothetical protein
VERSKRRGCGSPTPAPRCTWGTSGVRSAVSLTRSPLSYFRRRRVRLSARFRLRPELSLPSRFAFAATCRRYRWTISLPEAPAIRLAVASKAACIFSLTISSASRRALLPPRISFIIRSAITPFASTANNIKELTICPLCIAAYQDERAEMVPAPMARTMNISVVFPHSDIGGSETKNRAMYESIFGHYVIKGNLSDVVVPDSELSCSTVPPICLAREAINFNPDPFSLGLRMPSPLSDTVKRASRASRRHIQPPQTQAPADLELIRALMTLSANEPPQRWKARRSPAVVGLAR